MTVSVQKGANKVDDATVTAVGPDPATTSTTLPSDGAGTGTYTVDGIAPGAYTVTVTPSTGGAKPPQQVTVNAGANTFGPFPG
jgi:hypothetical protein